MASWLLFRCLTVYFRLPSVSLMSLTSWDRVKFTSLSWCPSAIKFNRRGCWSTNVQTRIVELMTEWVLLKLRCISRVYLQSLIPSNYVGLVVIINLRIDTEVLSLIVNQHWRIPVSKLWIEWILWWILLMVSKRRTSSAWRLGVFALSTHWASNLHYILDNSWNFMNLSRLWPIFIHC